MSTQLDSSGVSSSDGIDATAVSGGKIWSPEPNVVLPTKVVPSRQHAFGVTQWIFISVTVILFVISLIVLAGHFVEPSSTPETVTSAGMAGFSIYEFILLIALTFSSCATFTLLLERIEISEGVRVIVVLLSVLFILVPSGTSVLLANPKAFEAWAVEQYGYEVSYDDLTKYGESIPAVDVETGKAVTIYIETVDRKLVLKEQKIVFDNEAYADLETIKNGGIDMFRDKETGNNYIVERIEGEMVLTPYEGEEMDEDK